MSNILGKVRKEKNEFGIVADTMLKSMKVMLVSNAAFLICPFIDGLMTSLFLGADNMAAYGLDSTLNYVAMLICFFFVSGLKIVCSKLIGEGSLKKACRTYSITLVTMTALAVMLTLGVILFRGQIVTLLGASEEFPQVKQYAEDYLVGFSLGIPALCMLNAFTYVLYLDGQGRYASLTVIIQTIVDLIGNTLAIFVFKNGILGLGLATSASYIVSALFGVLFIVKKTNGLRFTFKGLDLRDLKDVGINGIPAAAERLFMFLRTLALNRILIVFGAMEAMTAFSMLHSVSSFYCIGTLCLAHTVLPMASNYYGEKDKLSLKTLFNSSLKIGLIMQCLITILVIVTAPAVMGMFTADRGTVFSMAVNAARFFALSLPFVGINTVYQNYICGTGRPMATSLLSFCSNCGLRVAGAALLGSFFGCNGVWLCFAFGDFVTILLVFIVKSIKLKRPAIRLSDYSAMSDEGSAVESLQMSAKDVYEVCHISAMVQEYASGHGASPREARLIALAVEELGRNIVVWGFGNDSHRVLDVRVLRNDDGWILRIRDNSRIIDPNKWVQINHPEDITANIGFRMIKSISKEIQYTSNFGINNLIVII